MRKLLARRPPPAMSMPTQRPASASVLAVADPPPPAAPPSAPSSASDADLVERWRGGDQAAGEQLFGRHFDTLYRFFATKCAEPGDLTQATLLAVVRSRLQFAGRSSFRTYLFSIARNELYDHLRAGKRAHFDPEISSIIDLVTTPATRLDRSDDHRRLCLALRELPLEQQTLLELHYWEDLDASALAEVFDSPPTTIRTRLHRARLALRKRLLASPLTPASAPPFASVEAQIEAQIDELDTWARYQRS
jgi:RNA polymerase sigma-70 factor (ECF subfamily)